MCGLYGLFGSGTIKDDLNVFHTLAFLNQLRGWDATGVLRVFRNGVKNNYRTDIHKDVVCAQDFFSKKENEDILKNVFPLAIMGHNRSATVGNSDDIRGAHPFDNDKFIGFHNGTLIEKRFREHKDYVTDSEALYAEIAEKGVQETVKKLSTKSAFALAMFNKETQQIEFVRNSHRPLWFATHQERQVVYYSSERRMLEFALNRAGIKHVTYEIQEWCHLRTDPGNFQIKPRDSNDKESGKVNYWFLDHLTPTPVEPEPEPVKTHNYPGVSSHAPWNNRLSCIACGNDVIFPNKWSRDNSAKDHPFRVPHRGWACADCADIFDADPVVPNNQEQPKIVHIG